MEEDSVVLKPSSLCIFCCDPINKDSPPVIDNPPHLPPKLSNVSRNSFVSFCEEIAGFNCGSVNRDNEWIVKLKSVLFNEDGGCSGLSLCEKCGGFVSVAVEVKGRVNRVEDAVRSLQRQVLIALRELREVLEEYYGKLRRMEEVVQCSNGGLLRDRVGNLEDVGGAVFLLREGIINGANSLRKHQDNLSVKLLYPHPPDFNNGGDPVEEVAVKDEPVHEEDFGGDDDYDTFPPSISMEMDCQKLELDAEVKTENAEDNTPIGPWSSRVIRRERKPAVAYQAPPPNTRNFKSKATEEAFKQAVKKSARPPPKTTKKKGGRSKKLKDVPFQWRKKKSKQAGKSKKKIVRTYTCDLCPDFKDGNLHCLEHHLRSHEVPLKTFKCDLCPQQYSCEQFYRIHKMGHDGKLKRHCDLCRSVLNPPDHLQHLKSHGDTISIFQCPNCSFVCGLRKTFLLHLNRHKATKSGTDVKFPCDICVKVFPAYGELERHLADEHNELIDKFECDEEGCDKSFPTLQALRNHERIGHRGHLCTECGKCFQGQGEMLEHKRKFHSWGYPCNQCWQKFTSQAGADVHMIKDHGAPKFKCDHCDKEYTNRSCLSQHLKLHKNIGFTCEHCGKLFGSNAQLQHHSVVHSNDRQFTCEQCGRAFKRKETMRKHIMTHDQTRKRYPCTVCNKTFSRMENRTVHMRIHRGERPYVCDLCGKDFNQSGALNVHKRGVHQVKTGE